MKKCRTFFIIFITTSFVICSLCAALTVFVDPYFHYHAPLSGKNYIMKEQRYINDGIVKNYDYDAMILGSSMTECFRTSVMDSLWNCRSIKVPFSGGSFCEVGDLERVALSNNPNLKIVVRGLDCNRFFNGKDERDYEEDSYPTYLYDNNYLNDVKYVFSKNAIIDSMLIMMQRGEASKPSSFDTYSNWNYDYAFGKDAILSAYDRNAFTPPEIDEELTEEDKKTIYENITQNVTDIADDYPDTEFYVYYTPYSIFYLDFFNRNGVLKKQIQAEEYITSLLLEHKNIHVYSFYMEHNLIENPDNYRDLAHHGQDMSDRLLKLLYEKEGEITKENYTQYYEELNDYYSSFDFDSLF